MKKALVKQFTAAEQIETKSWKNQAIKAHQTGTSLVA